MKERFIGSVEVCVLLACFATVFGFLGSFFWFFDLFSHFRVQYFLGLLGGGVLLLVFRKYYFAAAAFVGVAINLPLLLPFYFDSPPEAGDGKEWSAMLHNVNTFSGSPEKVIALVKEVDPHFLVLEEIDAGWVSAMKALSARYPYQVVEPRGDNFGIGLFSKEPLVEARTVYPGISEVPSVIATVETPEGDFQICGTHPLPPIGPDYARRRDALLASLPEMFSESDPVLLLGDFNTTPWGTAFRKLLRETNLIDSMKGRGIQATWPSWNPLLKIPLDHALHSPEIRIHERKTGPSAGSDHLPLLVKFSLLEEDSP